MEKTGQVQAGVTPCCVCGRPGEATHSGEMYCFSDYMKAKYKAQPAPPYYQTDKTASYHGKES